MGKGILSIINELYTDAKKNHTLKKDLDFYVWQYFINRMNYNSLISKVI